MLDIVDLITTVLDILSAVTCSWRFWLSCGLAVGAILVIEWMISPPWDLVVSTFVGLFALILGVIWERRS